jgi:oxygen-independent coproporphyrinogen-3 oxidase
MLGIYLHIPYCLRKCAYCDFASLPLDEAGGMNAARRYLDAVAVELDRRALSEEFLGCEVETVYIGGGTPTILPPEWIAGILQRLHHRFPFQPDAEITIEANPGTVDEAKIAALLAAGINRISLGVQSFSDSVLQTLGRIHSAAEAQDAIAAARAAGCTNLSLDLIYGIPNQSLDDWRTTLETAVEANPEHLSVYALSLEPETPLSAQIATGALSPPDEDLAADMYLLAQDVLGRADFDHYEISNFAQPDMQCRHNRRYWAYDEYLGLGAAAHSFRRGVRWNNVPGPVVYTEWLERGRLPVARAEALSAREAAGEMLMLGLRRAEGISEREVRRRTGVAVTQALAAEIARLREDGLLLAERGRLRIPREAWLVSNEVLSTFVA